MRKTVCIAVALLLGAGLGTQALAAPIDCSKVTVDIVEKAICGAPELIASDRGIAAAFSERMAQCSPPQRALLRQPRKFWLRDRNACANALSDGEGEVKRCVVERLVERLAERAAQLDRIGNACDLESVAGEYRYVEADYLAKAAARYVGREASVGGGITLSTCDVRSSDLTAKLTTISRKGGVMGDGFPVRFKAMPPEKREWLCAQNPVSHWHGTVRKDARGFYLYLTDILGEPL